MDRRVCFLYYNKILSNSYDKRCTEDTTHANRRRSRKIEIYQLSVGHSQSRDGLAENQNSSFFLLQCLQKNLFEKCIRLFFPLFSTSYFVWQITINCIWTSCLLLKSNSFYISKVEVNYYLFIYLFFTCFIYLYTMASTNLKGILKTTNACDQWKRFPTISIQNSNSYKL